MSILASKIYEKIGALVDAIGSQERFAYYAGVSQGIVSRWMAGTAAPSKKTRMKISAALGISYQMLLDDTAPLSEETLHEIQQKMIVDIQLERQERESAAAGQPKTGGAAELARGSRKQAGAQAYFEKLAHYHLKLLTDVAEHPFGRLILRPSLMEESLDFFMDAAKEFKPAPSGSAAARQDSVHGIIRLLKSLQSESHTKKTDEKLAAAALALAQSQQAAQMQELLKRLEKMEKVEKGEKVEKK